jgi:hypothetical protein
VIIRILGEGQFDVPDTEAEALNELDAAVEKAIAADDATAFGAALADLLGRVRASGKALPDDSLLASDALLPPSDATLPEARELLHDDGLIPG